MNHSQWQRTVFYCICCGQKIVLIITLSCNQYYKELLQVSISMTAILLYWSIWWYTMQLLTLFFSTFFYSDEVVWIFNCNFKKYKSKQTWFQQSDSKKKWKNCDIYSFWAKIQDTCVRFNKKKIASNQINLFEREVIKFGLKRPYVIESSLSRLHK